MRRAAAVVLTGLALVTLPISARADTALAVYGGVGAAVLLPLVCAIVAMNTDENEEEEEFARQGWMVGVAGSYAIETLADDLEDDIPTRLTILGDSTDLDVDDSLGVNGRVGYRCHRRFSTELEVEWLDRFKADVMVSGVGKVATVDLEPVVITVNMKGYLLTGRYQPFLLFGAGIMTAEATLRDTVGMGINESERETDFVTRFGGGIDLYATKHVVVSLEAEYVLPFDNLDEADYISIGWGFQYRRSRW